MADPTEPALAPVGAMAEAAPDRSSLRALLVARYADLKRRLARKLNSADWAEEALQETYVKLEAGAEPAPVRNPAAYLFRAAFHTALNQRRMAARKLSPAEVEAMLVLADDSPDPLRILEARFEVARLKEILATLPPRPRQILLAARLDGWTRPQIARHFGISVSMVEKELRWAQDYCAVRFKKGGGV